MLLLLKCICALLLLTIGGAVASVYLMPEMALRTLQQLARSRAGLVHVETEVAGVRMVYLDGGRGQALVLLHGFGGEKDSFTRVAAHLTASHRLIIPDLPGFGESEKSPTISYTLDAQIERLHAFIEKLDLKSISLGGNSMGGFIAAAYAARYPDEVNSLWLLAPAGVSTAPRSELAALLAERGKSLAPTTLEDFKLLLQFVVSKPPYLPDPVLRVLSERALANRELHDTIAKQTTDSAPLEARLNGLATPALIVWGGNDRVINVGAAAILYKLLPNSTVRIMPGIGHLPMVESPREAAEAFLEFRGSLH